MRHTPTPPGHHTANKWRKGSIHTFRWWRGRTTRQLRSLSNTANPRHSTTVLASVTGVKAVLVSLGYLAMCRFLDVLGTFKALLGEVRSKNAASIHRLQNGIGILDSTSSTVDSMRADLKIAEAEVAARIATVTTQRQTLAAESKKVDAEAGAAARQADLCHEAERKVTESERAASDDLARAEPFLAQVTPTARAHRCVCFADT